jgi:hypothetical protein
MAGTLTNPHDAEEQLKPYLAKVVDAEESRSPEAFCSPKHTHALEQALDKALELLGVQR